MAYKKIDNLLSKFRRDERGSFSMVWGMSSMVVMISIGAAYDISNMTRQQEQAQHLADTMALAASIAVDQDNDDRLVEGTFYTYEDITGQYKASAKNLKGKVQYDIPDDDDPNNAGLDDDQKTRLLARASVYGEYETSFLAIIPKLKSFEYGATSDVSYSLVGGKPASVFFAVDNSGSMGWLDTSGANKLLSLETSMKSFMDVLGGVNNPQNDIFRTALFPYSQDYYSNYSTIDSDGVIPARVVSPEWGPLTTSEINSMSTLYGTDSSGALEDAEIAFRGETAAHIAKNNVDNPLKYMIFMSDGSNNSSYECVTEEVWVPGESEYWLYTYRRGGGRGWGRGRGGGRTVTERYNSYQNWMNNNSAVTYHPGTNGYFEDQQVCSSGYHADTQSIASCNAMKNDGVTVYSIGYALIQGVNGVSASEINRAKDLLESCASSPSHYILANNSSQLDTVFEEIGQEIIEEVIRVKR